MNLYRFSYRLWPKGLLILILLTHTFFSIIAQPIITNQITNQQNNQTANQQTKTLFTVGYTDIEGFISKNSNGVIEGYGVELLNEIAHITGWTYEYVNLEWQDSLNQLANGNIDIMGLLQRTPEREKLYTFSTRIAGHQHTLLYTRLDNDSLFYNDITALNGLTIGLHSNTFQANLIESFIDYNGLSVKFKYFDSLKEMDQALLNKETDANVSGFMTANPSEWKLLRNLGSDPYYYAMPLNASELMEVFDAAFTNILRNDPTFIAKLTQKYYSTDLAADPLFTRLESNYIKNTPVLRVMINNMSYPLEYFNSSGEFCGVYADYFKRVAEITGLTFEYVPIKTIDQLLNAIKSYDIDLIAHVPENNIMKEEHNIGFTNPYTSESLEVIGKNVNDSFYTDSSNPTAIIPMADGAFLAFLREKFPNWQITAQGTVPEALKDVSRNNYNIACCNKTYLQSLFNLNDYGNLVVYAGLSENIPVSIGIVDGSDVILTSILNKAIATISEEQVERFRTDNTITIPYKPNILVVIKNSLPFLLIVSLFLCLFAFFLLRRREKRYKRWAMEDNLTGIWNSRKFEFETNKLLDKLKNQSYALYTIDINKFKFINQSYGSGAGDFVLQQMAEKLPLATKSFIYFARSFADRFYVLLEVKDETEAISYAKEVSNFNFEIIGASCREFNLVAKLGIIMITPESRKKKNPDDVKTLIGKANIARHTIKEHLTHSYAFYDEAMDMLVTAENSIEDKMEHALSTDQFIVYFQPKFNLATEQICGAEALVRWKDPEKGMIPPDFFIPIFERNGFVIELDFYVYEQVFKYMRKWLDEGKELVTISVNMSRIHVGTSDFVHRFLSIASKYNINPSLVEIEVTESTFGDDDCNVKFLVSNLKEKGFRISMDDFGAGYSSLNLLKEVPVDVLKIDRNFLAEATNSAKTTVIIEKVVEMARLIAIETVCEGVENRSQAVFLQSIGCDTAQGFLFAKPMPPDEFAKLLS